LAGRGRQNRSASPATSTTSARPTFRLPHHRPEGHIVLDAGYPTTARMIMASIAKLGFDIKDVKVL
jgi:hypothetical protein